MKALVVGGDGRIGSELVRLLRTGGHDVIPTSRRQPVPDGWLWLDLDGPMRELPACDVVYLVAAIHTFQGCEGNAAAWRINVDAPCEIVRKCGAFPVFVSSDCVEWGGVTAYARMKASVEMFIQAKDGAIVRPSRVTPDRLGMLCELMRRVGENREAGVHGWQ